MQKISIILVTLLLTMLGTVSALADDGQLSTHILDINRGMPAEGVEVSLFKFDQEKNEWVKLTSRATGKDGRIVGLLPESGNEGTYKLRFETAEYFSKSNTPSIYPYVEVAFKVEGSGHYHIPLTLSANGYSTYKGS